MKQILSIILSVIVMFSLVPVNAFAEETFPEEIKIREKIKEYDFKEFRWGDSKEQVIAIEGTPLLEKKLTDSDITYLAYETKVLGTKVWLFYYFGSEGLARVAYNLQEEHSDNSLYIEDYETFKEELTTKYGVPYYDKEEWQSALKKESYKDDKGKALEYGYVKYLTKYLTDRTEIAILMEADNYKISTYIGYDSLDIPYDEQDYSEKNSLKNIVPGTTSNGNTVDLSGMTFDELSELRTAINKEMLSRGFEKEVTVPVGTYIIGQDIPAGIYVISSNASMCIVETYDIYGKDDEYYILNRNEKIGKMVLVDGQTIEIRGGASTFAPYTGIGF